MRSRRPTVNDLNALGVTFYRAGAYDLAIAQLEAAVRLAPESAVIRSNLGAAYYGKGRVADAEGEFRRALALAPGRAAIRRFHGLCMLRLGNSEEALADFHWVLEHAPGTWEARSAREEIWAIQGRGAAGDGP